MRLISYLALILVLAAALVPTAVNASNGCEGGVCQGITAKVNPESGPVGTQVTLTISSTGRTVGGDYRLWWGTWTDDPNEANFELVNDKTERTNIYEVVVDFVVPEVPYKTSNYLIYFYNPRVNAEGPAVSTWFKVEPSIKVSPSSASPGSKITISGTGFTANNDDFELSLDGKATAIDIATSSKGSFTAEFTIPDAIAGDHSFKTAAQTIFGKDATASLKIVPGISLEPEFPGIGEEVTITGCGFAASSEISIKYDDIAVTTSPATDEVGNFTHFFTIPETPEAEHEITVTDKAGNTATFSLPLEGEAPSAPATVSPREHRFGWLGSQVVTFSWTEVADPSGITYTLEIADNLNFFPLAPGMRKSGLTQPSCIVKLEPGTYFWRVKAIDGAGNESEWSLSPSAFEVGFFSIWYLVIGGFIFLIIAIFIIRAFFRRISEYYF